MNKHLKRRHLVGIGLAAVALIAASGVAFAYWTANGNGSGSADAAAGTSDITVNLTSTLTPMYPGDSPQTLSGDFDNANSGPVFVSTVTVTIDSVTKDPGAPAGTCDATDFVLSGATVTVGAQVPAGTGVGSWGGATIQFNNKPTNQDACKGATVNLGFSIP
jgi:hypothetical protein